MSDTSEAPSVASHVRRVRVPSHASDVDQYLDELFMPVLDANLDELSDARSLAASIKGGGGMEAATNRGPTTNGPGVSGTSNGPGTGPASMFLPPLPLFPPHGNYLIFLQIIYQIIIRKVRRIDF